jgi:hypothetical protein
MDRNFILGILKNTKAEKGIVPIAILIIFLPLIIVGVFLINPQNLQKIVPKTSPKISPSPTATPSSSASLSPTSSPTIKPTKTPSTKPSASPQSTPIPFTNIPDGTGSSQVSVGTERGTFAINLVTIDMAGSKMITDTANEGDCGDNCATLSLTDFVFRNNGFAGIHGTYFCPEGYAECVSKKDSFDFPVYNSRLGKWINGGNLFWNDRSIIYYDGSGMHFLRDAKSFGGGLTAGIVNSPGLVDGGNVIAGQFPLSDKQTAKGTKGGIGIRENIVYLVAASNVDMLDLAYVFQKLGCTSALNLDGGGSTALWLGGYKAGPGRNIPNAVIFAPK